MIATAEELREASEMSREARQEKSKEELLKSWMKHFEKTVDRAIKDAVRAGSNLCSIQLPWQPGRNHSKYVRQTMIDGVTLQNWVKEQLPGCAVDYVEEEYEKDEDGEVWYVMEISWAS